jgi:hypothetical protein
MYVIQQPLLDLLSGIARIFLAFLTSNNAVEIAISRIASVFVGIGVNNYSMIEGHLKEERQIKMKIGQSAHILRVTNSMQILMRKLTRLKVKTLNQNLKR